jgi:hypothetical protein
VSPVAISCIVFACVFGGSLLGMFLRRVLPEGHFSQDTKDIVKLGTGLVATMAALVLGLLISSAKSSFDMQNNQVIDLSANVVLMDRMMAHYGPETKDLRELLRVIVVRTHNDIWPEDRTRPARLDPAGSGNEVLYEKIQELVPGNESQRFLKGQMLDIMREFGQERWLIVAEASSSVSMTLLVILVSWLVFIFISFGLFAPRNATTVATLFLCALSVTGAILLILEMYRPFGGLIAISDAPMRAALAHLGQ